jgi:hypothetical protein
MRRAIATAILLLGGCLPGIVPAAAQPTPAAPTAPPSGQPAEVARATEGLFQECRGFGGTPSLMADFQSIYDLNADGRPDYILDVSRLNCAGAASALCAGVGCPLQVFLSSPRGYADARLGHFVQGWDVDVSARPPVLVLSLGQAACGRNARADCTLRYRWNGAALAQVGAPPAAPRAATPPAAGGDPKPEAARPAPAASRWELRTAGTAPVATTPGPGVIQSLSLLCAQGTPVAAFVMRAAPPPGKTIVRFSLPSGSAELGVAAQAGGSNRVLYGDLRGSSLPRLLASGASGAAIRINGGQQGTLALAGAAGPVREALAGCYRF